MNQTYLLPHLAKFLAKYPKLKLKLIVAESALDLPPEHIDVCYGTTLEGPSNWVRKVLFKTHYGLYAAPKYLKKMGHPLTPQALKNYHFITHMHRPEVLGLELGGQKITLSAYLLTNDCTSMLHAVMQGLGFAMLLECFVREEVAEGKLVEILPEYLNKTLRPLSLYYPSARYLQPKVRAFVDFFANIEFNKNLT